MTDRNITSRSSTTRHDLRFAGTVAYVFPGMGFGIKFNDITDRHLALLGQIVKPSGE